LNFRLGLRGHSIFDGEPSRGVDPYLTSDVLEPAVYPLNLRKRIVQRDGSSPQWAGAWPQCFAHPLCSVAFNRDIPARGATEVPALIARLHDRLPATVP
jgi:hypothetical protein